MRGQVRKSHSREIKISSIRIKSKVFNMICNIIVSCCLPAWLTPSRVYHLYPSSGSARHMGLPWVGESFKLISGTGHGDLLFPLVEM